MKLTNFKWDKPIFYQVAIYCCKGCGYKSEIYSNFEWITDKYEADFCGCCGQVTPNRFWTYFLYRWDHYNYGKLTSDLSGLPRERTHCAECNLKNGVSDNVHWTELMVDCPYCESDMIFYEYTEGTKIDEFKAIAIEETKLKASDMQYCYEIDSAKYFGVQSGINTESAGNLRSSKIKIIIDFIKLSES